MPRDSRTLENAPSAPTTRREEISTGSPCRVASNPITRAPSNRRRVIVASYHNPPGFSLFNASRMAWCATLGRVTTAWL